MADMAIFTKKIHTGWKSFMWPRPASPSRTKPEHRNSKRRSIAKLYRMGRRKLSAGDSWPLQAVCPSSKSVSSEVKLFS